MVAETAHGLTMWEEAPVGLGGLRTSDLKHRASKLLSGIPGLLKLTSTLGELQTKTVPTPANPACRTADQGFPRELGLERIAQLNAANAVASYKVKVHDMLIPLTLAVKQRCGRT